MLKILIVEDSQEKLQKITAVLSDVEGIDLESITSVMDAYNAKVKLAENAFDLLILDIAIPPRIDQEVKVTAGVELLDEISERRRFNVPTNIIGMTAYPEVLADVRERFSRRLLNVVYFDPTSDEWERALQSRAKQILLAKVDMESSVRPHESFLAIVCALETPELNSILRLPWSWTQVHVPNDLAIYHQGYFIKNDERRLVYAAAANRMGMSSSSILSMKMISAFQPRYLAIAGITAGVPGRASYGDIIAADPSWDWGSGKWETRDGELSFIPAPHQIALEPELRSKLKILSSQSEVFRTMRKEWPGDVPDQEIKLHIGPLASGASVLADGSFVEMVKQQHRQVLGIEMETYGVFAAADEAVNPRPKVFCLKSVVDFADANKDDKYQKYAAYTSAQCLKEFVESYL
jgi:nucleoside phosphorylase/CheY-like chemotaxis protein